MSDETVWLRNGAVSDQMVLLRKVSVYELCGSFACLLVRDKGVPLENDGMVQNS
jgi:hypothetical protein